MELDLEMPVKQEGCMLHIFHSDNCPSVNKFATVHHRLQETGTFSVSFDRYWYNQLS